MQKPHCNADLQHRICDTSSIDDTVAGIIQGKLMMVEVAVGHTSVTLLRWQLHMQVRKGCAQPLHYHAVLQCKQFLADHQVLTKLLWLKQVVVVVSEGASLPPVGQQQVPAAAAESGSRQAGEQKRSM